MARQNIGSLFMGDRIIWIVFFFLCIISLIEVYSAASTLSYETGRFWMPLIKQACFLAAGTVLAVVVHCIPCRKFKCIPIIFIPISIVLLCVTIFSGAEINGGSRWLSIAGISFQPSEIAKGAVVVNTALILSRNQREDGAEPRAFKSILGWSIPLIFLIALDNLSTAALLFGVVVLMMFIGRISLVQLGKLFGVLALGVILFAAIVMLIPKSASLGRIGTWKNRFTTHFVSDPKENKDDPRLYDLTKNAQVAHANIAIASSSGIGRMPGNSVERDFLAQAFSDFIFAIIIEETGLIGATIVVFLYIILLFRTGRICSRCERNFPPFLAMGLTLLLVSQAVLNMMVAVGLFPVTGQPLPLISRGGTSTLINCIYIGMILSVSRHARQVKEAAHTDFDGTMRDIKHQ